MEKSNVITLQNRRLQDIAILLYKVKTQTMPRQNMRVILHALLTLQLKGGGVRHSGI